MIYKNGWTVNKVQQKLLFITCNITALTSYYVYKNNLPNYVAYPIYAVWLSSNLYWYNPLDNWRRKVDMITAHFCIPFLSLCGIIYKPSYWYLTSLGICSSAVIFRTISVYYYNLLEQLHNNKDKKERRGIYNCPIKNSYSWKSTLAHTGIHIFTNLFAALAAYTYTI